MSGGQEWGVAAGVTTPTVNRLYVEGLTLAPALKRLGELYEARGDRKRAAEYYEKFVDLWKNADPELQPGVTEARRWLAALSREGPEREPATARRLGHVPGGR